MYQNFQTTCWLQVEAEGFPETLPLSLSLTHTQTHLSIEIDTIIRMGLCTPWKRKWNWRPNANNSQPRLYMNVSGELHVPAALIPEPAITFIRRVAGLTAVLDTRRSKSLAPSVIEQRILGYSTCSTWL